MAQYFKSTPTWLLRDCAHDIVHVLTTIFSMSLRIDIMPSHLKGMHVRPVIKKPNLHKVILNNYRPVCPICIFFGIILATGLKII